MFFACKVGLITLAAFAAVRGYKGLLFEFALLSEGVPAASKVLIQWKAAVAPL